MTPTESIRFIQETWVLLWSERHHAFHICPLSEAIESSLREYLEGATGDYVIIDASHDHDELVVARKVLELARDGGLTSLTDAPPA